MAVRPIEKLITEPVLNDILADYLSKFQQAGTKLSDESAKAVEEQFWKLIKPALGEGNWSGNNYKGSLQVEEIKKIIQGELKDFKPWTLEQDTENIKKVVGYKNFVNGELSIPAGWDKEKDLQNLKDNKPYLSEVVKDNLGDFKKEVDSKFEASKTELQTKLNEADAKIKQGETKLTETANTIKKDVEDKATAIKKDVDEKLAKADTDIKTKLGEVDAKLVKSDTDIKEKLKGVDAKLETADKEIKAKLEQVDKKFEPFKPWEQTKEDIIPVIIENLENKKPLWRKLRDNLDKENFYSEEPHQDTSVGREGMWKNQADIAKQQARYADEIAAAKLWVKFFKDHNVASDQETIWQKRFPANPEGAEGYYTDAILRAAKLVGTKQPLNDLEKNEILKSPTPDKIEEAILNIPKERTKQAWREFFEEVDITNQIKPEWRTHWEESGLNRPQAEIVYKNGWRNDPARGVIKDGNIETYTTIHYDIDDNKHEETTKNVNPLVHIESELVRCHNFIFKRILSQTDLTKFPDDAEIQDKSRSYDESLIPESRNYERTIKLRDKTRLELFKKYFEGEASSQLSPEEIEVWRTSETGLPMTGKDQRKAFDNGWIYPNEIKGGRTEYKGVKNIDVLKYKKTDVDKEIDTVDEWVKQIQGYKKLRELDKNINDINTLLLHLNENLLPQGSKEKIETEITNARNRLNYYLGDPEDGGIDEARLQQIEQAIKIKQPQRTYATPTVETLINFINASTKPMGIKIKDEGRPAGSIDDWLKSKRAYKFEDTPEGKKMIAEEDLLDLEMRGQYLIPFSYKKAVEGGGVLFDPDNLDATSFCKTRLETKTKWGRTKTFPVIDGTQGHLPFATGIGKTTKVVNCICRGGEFDEINQKEGRNIILVMPTQVLVEGAYGHHNSETGWLQKWGCVNCQVWVRGAKVKRGTYTLASEEEIANGEYETKDIFKSHGKYKVVKNDLLPKPQKGLSIITGDELIGWLDRQLLIDSKEIDKWKPEKGAKDWFQTQKEIDDWKAEITSKLIDKKNDIILVDEGHFAIPAYQAVQVQSIFGGYNVVRMSATFENQPFSITSTYQRDNLYVGAKLNPNWVVGNENGKSITFNQFLATNKIWFFLPSLDLTPEQVKSLGNISWIAYTPEWDEYVEPVSYGMPRPSWSFVSSNHSVGMNPDAGGVVLGGKITVKELGGKFSYKYNNDANLTQADGIQMMGRVGRSKKGKAFFLSLKWEEIDTSKDVAAAMVESMFDGETKHIAKEGYHMIQDIAMLRAAIALPKKFGSPLEEILIGVNATEKSEKARLEARQPLTKIEWRTENDKPSYTFGEVDKDLWNSYLGIKKTPKMNKDIAKDRLLECIATYISEAEGFPKKINVWRQSNLVEFIWGQDIKAGKKAPIVAEIRKVLNGVIEKGIDSYSSSGYDKITKTAKDRRVIEDVSHYYKVADANIDVSYQWNKEKTQQLLTLIIEKN